MHDDEQRQQLIAQIHSGIWQQEAAAWLLLRNRRPWLDWQDPSQPPGVCYKSFSAFCKVQKVTNATAYWRARLAADPRFAQLREVDMDITTAEALYELPMDSPLFELALELRRYGAPERDLRALLTALEPLEEARRLFKRREQENRLAHSRLVALLSPQPASLD